MRSRWWTIALLLLTQNVFSQPLNESKINRIAVYGKIWGFLKYYHPKAGSGKVNWDEVFVNNYHSVKNITNNIDFNRKVTRLLDSVGITPPGRSKALGFPDSLKRNLNINWIYDTTVLSLYNSSRLAYIFENHQPFENYYITRQPRVGNPVFKNENAHADIILPNEPYRVLALMRFWNIINYYFPYLYLIDQKWDTVLNTFIPRFVNVSSDYEYFRKIQELATQINDAHGMVFSGKYNYFARLHMVPLKFATIDDKTYIIDLLNDSLCYKAGVQKGDILKKLDIFEVDIIRSHHARYMPASNKTFLNYKVDQWLPLVKTNMVDLEIERNGTIIKTRIASVNSSKKLNLHPDKKYIFTNWKLLSDSVGYINMGLLSRLDIDPAYDKLKHTKYLIIDSRNYPNWIVYPLADKLLRTRKVFMQITEPDYDYPGHVKYIPSMKAGNLFNPDYYKGKIILLINSETMSRAEFTAMAIMQAENVTVIGTQTAGADGDVSTIPLPGGIYCHFSGLGVFHPNGRDTQRVGLLPDIEVKPTLEGLIKGEDEYINRAMEFIRTGK